MNLGSLTHAELPLYYARCLTNLTVRWRPPCTYEYMYCIFKVRKVVLIPHHPAGTQLVLRMAKRHQGQKEQDTAIAV